MKEYRYEDLPESERRQIEAYEWAIEDMYQAIDDFEATFGESTVDQIKEDVLEEAFTYLKEKLHDCRQLLINEYFRG